MKTLLAILLLTVAGSASAQGTPNCLSLATFPQTTIAGKQVPVCHSACQTVRPPRCTDLNMVFPARSPVNPPAPGAYDDVTCSNLETFPKVTRSDGQQFIRCVNKCPGVRPPKCVDYNKELG